MLEETLQDIANRLDDISGNLNPNNDFGSTTRHKDSQSDTDEIQTEKLEQFGIHFSLQVKMVGVLGIEPSREP